MATIDLGKIKLVWRGTYAGGTAYTVDDVVSHTDSGIVSSYICTTNSTGNAPSTGGSVHGSWAYLAKGASAYTSTLTTQGDILYRDGSGEARLGYGTAGQVLQTGGSGANPSWGTVSSDFVKLGSGTVTSGSSFHINGYFSSTYQTYKIMLTGVNAWFKCRFNFGGSYTTHTGSNYVWVVSYASQGNGSTGHSRSGNWNGGEIPLSYWSGDGSEEHHYSEISLYKPWDATNRAKNIFCHAYNYDSSNVYVHHNAGFLDGNKYDEAMTGLNIYPTSGSLSDTNWEIYGIK